MGQSPDEISNAAPSGPQAASPGSDTTTDPRDHFFSTDHLKGDLKRSSVRGGVITMVGQGVRIFLTMASQFVLCRLVTPDDFGLFFMVATLTAFAEIFKEMGLSMAVIQKEKVTHKEVSNVFWVNVFVGFIIMLVVMACAKPIAGFYGRDALVPITLWLSVTFLVAGCTAQHRALLNRSMNYKALTINELDSLFLGIIAAVFVGLMHKYGAAVLDINGVVIKPAASWHVHNGWWALVVQRVVQGFAQAIGVWKLSKWRPSMWSPSTSIRSYLGFGANLTGFEIVNYFSRNMDNVLVGKVWGDFALGFYGNAYKLLLVPAWQINTPITRVAMPALSRLQNDPQKFRQYYHKSIGLLTFIGMPVVALMTCIADKAIPVALGPKWGPCVPIFLALSPAAFAGTYNVATGWVHSSLGRPHRQFIWGMISAICCVSGFFISIWEWSYTLPGLGWTIHNPGGPIAVAWSFSITFCLVTMGPVAFWYCYRDTPLRMRNIWFAVYRQAFCSIMAGVITWRIDRLFPETHGTGLYVAFFILCLIYAVIYLALFACMPHGKSFMIEIVQMGDNFRKKKSKPQGFPIEPTTGTPSNVAPSSVDPSVHDTERQDMETTGV